MEKTRGRTLGPGRVDIAKVDATTEDDTRRHMVEDGLDPADPLAGFTPASMAAEVRRKAEMSQDAFARALHVPVKTIRNWEQGRSRPDPAAWALLAIVDDDPTRAFAAIGRRVTSIADYVKGPVQQYPASIGNAQISKTRRGSKAVLDAADAVAKTAAETLDAALRKL